MAIILRLDKGSELTFAEVDGNFSSLFYSGSLNGTNLEFYTYNNVLSQSFDLSNLPGFGGVGVEYDGGNVVTAANIINFTGTGVTVTANGNTANVDISGGGGSSTYTNLTPTPINFPSDADPNIPADTTFQDKTFTEMMNMMLYPTLYPTLTNPSLSGVNLSPNGFQIIGTLITSGNLTLSCTFNRGTINPAYTTSGLRSGPPNTYNYTSPASAFVTSVSTTDTDNTVNNTSTYEVTSGTNSFSVSVNYDEGPQPLNSIGGDFDSPLAAGNNPPGSTSRSMTGVYPVFATTVTAGVFTQQALQNMGSNDVIVTMIGETGGPKQAIAIPNTLAGQPGFTAFTDVQQEDPLAPGTFIPITGGLTTFTLDSTDTRTVEGNTVTYNLYTHNGSQIGSRQLKFIN
jgi:hypothetical protein